MATKNPKDGSAPPPPQQPETLEAALIALDDKEARIAHWMAEAEARGNLLSAAEAQLARQKEALETSEAKLAQRDRELTEITGQLVEAKGQLEKAQGAQRTWPDEQMGGRRMAARALGIDPAEILAWRVSDDGHTVTVTTVDGQKLDNRA